jgi:hypothetical protein
MSAATEALAHYVLDHTCTYRKGEPVRAEKIGDVAVVTMDFMPPREQAPPDAVDLHFLLVAAEKADKDEFVPLLRAALGSPGEFTNIDARRLIYGPSYIELGGWLGSQDVALRFIGLGAVLGLWKPVTPASLGITGPDAEEMAGRGFVMLGPTGDLVSAMEGL